MPNITEVHAQLTAEPMRRAVAKAAGGVPACAEITMYVDGERAGAVIAHVECQPPLFVVHAIYDGRGHEAARLCPSPGLYALPGVEADAGIGTPERLRVVADAITARIVALAHGVARCEPAEMVLL